MDENKWIYCPVCHNKTRTKVRKDTELKFFPLFCPKCKRETIIHFKKEELCVVSEPEQIL